MASVDYKDVISGKIKPQRDKPFSGGLSFTPITFVSWDNAPKHYNEVDFHTICKTRVIMPPDLPDGFRMEDHDDWYAIAERIREGIDTAPFERVDLMFLDLETLADCAGSSWIADTVGYWPWDVREDYLKWSLSFDQAWDDVMYDVLNIVRDCLDDIGSKYPDYVPIQSKTADIAAYLERKGSDRLPLPNRTMPPPQTEIIQHVIDYLSGFKSLLEKDN